MRPRWEFKTRAGLFAIEARGGNYLVFCGDESLGSYHSPEAALDDLVGGHTFWPSSGVDPSRLGLPTELGAWTLITR